MKKDIDFIRSFFKTLRDNDIEYCVLIKADMIISGKAHDIDMAIDFSKIDEVYKILDEIAITFGWKPFLNTLKDNGNMITLHYFTIYRKQIYIVHFDLFKSFSWQSIILLKSDEIFKEKIENQGVFSCSKSTEAITKLFSRYLYHGYIKEEYKDDIVDIFLNNSQKVIRKMSLFLSSNLSKAIYELVVNKRWKELIGLSSKIKLSIKSNHCKNYIDKIKDKFSNIMFKLKRYFVHKGVMVAFLGSDGSGKSTIISNLPNVLGRTFDETQIKYYHWRPKFIKSPRNEFDNISSITNPHKNKPYNKIISFIKFMYFNLDYILGYWFSVKIHLGKNKLVIFDRYYYDYLIDKYRYRLNLSDKIIKFFLFTIPKPDITFLLVGDPKVIYERKKEISIDKIQNQIYKLIEQKDKFENSKIINVNNKIDDVIFDVCSYILNFMKDRYKQSTFKR